jgi:copper chaperone
MVHHLGFIHPDRDIVMTSSSQTPTHTFTVTGMTCGHCEKAVVQAVKALDPQAQVQADRSHNQVVVQSSQPRSALAAAIAEEGYTVADAA